MLPWQISMIQSLAFIALWITVTFIVFWKLEKIYTDIRDVIRKILEKLIKREEHKDNFYMFTDRILDLEKLLYIAFSSFFIFVFLLGLLLKILEPKLLILSILYFVPALITHKVKKLPWEGRNKFLKTGLLLVNSLIVFQGSLVILNALLKAITPKNTITSIIESILNSLNVELPVTLARDFLALLFFLGIYQVLRYFETPGKTEEKTERWDIAIIISTLKAIFIFPIVAFAVLLSLDFISAFHAIPSQIQGIPMDMVVAIFSGIIAMTIEMARREY